MSGPFAPVSSGCGAVQEFQTAMAECQTRHDMCQVGGGQFALGMHLTMSTIIGPTVLVCRFIDHGVELPIATV
jgi:hypothetical protein